MFEFETDRLLIRTNMAIDNGEFKYLYRNRGKSIDQFEPTQDGDNEFAIMSKENRNVRYGGIGIVIKENAKIIEIKYSIKDEFQHRGYITEALNAIVQWIFTNTGIEKIEANCIHETSVHILRDIVGFKFDRIDERYRDHKWYVLTKCSYIGS